MNPRPSHKELSNKIKTAKRLLETNSINILEPHVVLADSLDLGYSFKLEFQAIIEQLLDTVSPGDYAGSRPPQQSYETEIKGADLFAFVVQCPFLDNKNVYFKFALYQDVLVVVSLHEDKKQEG